MSSVYPINREIQRELVVLGMEGKWVIVGLGGFGLLLLLTILLYAKQVDGRLIVFLDGLFLVGGALLIKKIQLAVNNQNSGLGFFNRFFNPANQQKKCYELNDWKIFCLSGK